MILFLTNADSEILCARSVVDGLPPELGALRCANPIEGGRFPLTGDEGVVVVRLLGGRRAWQEGFDALRKQCIAAGVPLAAFGGEAVPDGELAALSTAPPDVITDGFSYLAHGGPLNVERFFRFVGDRLLGLGLGYGPPEEVPMAGIMGEATREPGRPTIVVLFYRALYVAGNVASIRVLCEAVRARGANAVAVFCYSLRDEAGELAVSIIRGLEPDCLVTTVWASGTSSAEGDAWDVTRLASLDVPVVQAVAATTSLSDWEESSIGLGPRDVAMSVAIPEFDGRIVTVPFSFKETVDNGERIGAPVTSYRWLPDRVERVAGVACAHARLRHISPDRRRIAIVLSAYPTKRSRLGNAVGLDTPASLLRLLAAMQEAGYVVGEVPESGDTLMARLMATMLYDPAACVDASSAAGALSAEDYAAWFGSLPKELRAKVEEAWGENPGTLFVDEAAGALSFAGLDLSKNLPGPPGDPDIELPGAVFVAVQPPRGFGENPVAVYHSPDLPPTHHYLGFYRWLTAPVGDGGWGAHAVVHVGKHGTLEWLPGKGVGLSAACFPDAALGDVPLVYPFVVNDPGEGAQAKRRAHAVVVDHLVPPMTRAGLHDDLAVIEALLDEHQRLLAMDPSKLPALRRELWSALVAAEIHRDLGVTAREVPRDSADHDPLTTDLDGPDFDDPRFDDLIGHVDGYLCELKDAQIRGGLHILGTAPEGDALIEMVLALTRCPQGKVPSLRAAVARRLGVNLEVGSRNDVDRVEEECRRSVVELADRGWSPPSSGTEVAGNGSPGGDAPCGGPSGERKSPDESVVLQWIAERLVPDLRASTSEIASVLRGLEGRFVPPGPSGAPTRSMAHVLPTGRNFYTLDPRAIPSRLSWETGLRLADGLVARYLREEGAVPAEVAIVVWGTATMRTSGDDMAEALALLGVRPVWDGESGRVTGLEVIPAGELGRPRVGVTLRISGFFRDAFSHLIAMFEEAVELVRCVDEPPEVNPLVNERRGSPGEEPDPRVFGPKPGAYGSGILAAIESGQWRDSGDLATVYLTWGGFAYGGGGAGRPAPEAVRRRFAHVDVVAKNQDNREHDIFDSDDYLQDHGGLVATVLHLSGARPRAYFGDSADSARPVTRDLKEEAVRVVRSRVLNPKWIEAMRRHGYKGAFELAATVDYLFGYDATAGIADDWMYTKIAERYVGDPAMREFFHRSNPHALTSIAERLLEAAQREMWDAPAEVEEMLRSAVLEAEGWDEGSG